MRLATLQRRLGCDAALPARCPASLRHPFVAKARGGALLCRGAGPDSRHSPSGTTESSSRKSSGGGARGEPPPPPPPDAEPQGLGAQVLATHAAFAGVVGSLAVNGAAAAHVDLWGMLDFAARDEMALALALLVPLQVANLLLMAPDWAAADLSSPPRALPPTSSTPPTASTSSPQQEDAAAVPARLWGQARGRRSSDPAPAPPAPASVARDALFLAQSHYVNSNPTLRVGPWAELALALVDSLASEMLLRGLLLTCAARWAVDRMAAAGWRDPVDLPAAWFTALAQGASDVAAAPTAALLRLDLASGGTLVVAAPMEQVGLWAAGGLGLAALLLLSARRALRLSRQAALMADIRQRLLSTTAQLALSRRGGGGSASPSGSLPGAAPPTGALSGALRRSQARSQAPEEEQGGGGDEGPAAPDEPHQQGGGGGGGAPLEEQGGAPWARPPPVVFAAPALPPSLRPPPSASVAPMVWAAGLQCSRDLLQSSTLTLAFVATGGNLAACVTAAFVNQAVLSALQRLGARRARKRNMALAAELREISARLGDLTQGAAKVHARQRQRRSSSSEQGPSPGPAPTPTPPPPPPQQQQPPPAMAPTTGLARTLSTLDLLVPDPPKQQQPASSSPDA